MFYAKWHLVKAVLRSESNFVSTLWAIFTCRYPLFRSGVEKIIISSRKLLHSYFQERWLPFRITGTISFRQFFKNIVFSFFGANKMGAAHLHAVASITFCEFILSTHFSQNVFTVGSKRWSAERAKTELNLVSILFLTMVDQTRYPSRIDANASSVFKTFQLWWSMMSKICTFFANLAFVGFHHLGSHNVPISLGREVAVFFIVYCHTDAIDGCSITFLVSTSEVFFEGILKQGVAVQRSSDAWWRM